MRPALADPDLPARIRLAWRYIGNALDHSRGGRPYFSWALADEPAYALHTHYDCPHVVGRFLDALLPAEPLAGERCDPDVERSLTRQLFASMEHDPPLGWSDSGRAGVPEILIHDQREALFGLVDLIEYRDSDEARRATARFCRTMHDLLGDAAAFPGYALRADGWDVGEGHAFFFAPAGSGRLIHALVRDVRATGDPLALDMARRFADDVRARCFTPDGRLTPLAGFHFHSVTGTVEGLAEFGLLVGEREYLDHAKRIYDVGLAPHCTRFGWVKENLANSALDGEANNTGDVLRTALLLARHGYPEYYEHAERALRNHLLASQLLSAEWVVEDPSQPDTAERGYRDIARRAVGGFGFTTPNDWLVDMRPKLRAKPYPLNADLVQGAVQGILACWLSAVTEDATGVRVNLFLDRHAHGVNVRSRMASRGEVDVTVERPLSLWLRRPSWAADPSAVHLTVDGQRVAPQTNGAYFGLPNLTAGSCVHARFDRHPRTETEFVEYTPFDVTWLGDNAIGISPPGDRLPLFGEGAAGGA